MNVTAWLCDGDPAIHYQTLLDLTGAPPAQLCEARSRISQEGIAAEILAKQQPDGAWRQPGKPTWRCTLFTMQLLRLTGIDPADSTLRQALDRAEANLHWNEHDGFWDLRSPQFGGNGFFDGEVEPCINGGVFAFGSYCGHPSERLARLLLSQQLADGGWNCEAPEHSSVSSYHTTICVLEGLLEFEKAFGATTLAAESAGARKRAEEYLLERALLRRRSTGEPADPKFLQFAFPPRHRYDVLRALDYFRASSMERDARMGAAVSLIEGRRQPDGRWLLDDVYDDALTVSTGEIVGAPSRWNTLRALRVLNWFRPGAGLGTS
jgi:hypothetical protein